MRAYRRLALPNTSGKTAALNISSQRELLALRQIASERLRLLSKLQGLISSWKSGNTLAANFLQEAIQKQRWSDFLIVEDRFLVHEQGELNKLVAVAISLEETEEALRIAYEEGLLKVYYHRIIA